MFCMNCGKELPNNVNFCNYCGVPVNNAPPVFVQTAQSPAAEAEQPAVPAEQEFLRASEEISPLPAEPVSEELSEADKILRELDEISGAKEPPAEEAPANVPVKTPVHTPAFPATIPINGAPYNSNRNIARKAEFSPVLPEKNDAQGIEPKYTLKHIIMCLAAAAVCACAAGVFAGLYFSVV